MRVCWLLASGGCATAQSRAPSPQHDAILPQIRTGHFHESWLMTDRKASELNLLPLPPHLRWPSAFRRSAGLAQRLVLLARGSSWRTSLLLCGQVVTRSLRPAVETYSEQLKSEPTSKRSLEEAARVLLEDLQKKQAVHASVNDEICVMCPNW